MLSLADQAYHGEGEGQGDVAAVMQQVGVY